MLGIERRQTIGEASSSKAHFILTSLEADAKDRIPLRCLTQKDLKPAFILANIRERYLCAYQWSTYPPSNQLQRGPHTYAPCCSRRHT